MVYIENLGVLLGAIALGAAHGVEPGHGWPVAASYALDRSNKWLYGLAASLLIGIGHLVSSIAMVSAFFYAKSYFDLAQVDDPIALPGGIEIGGPVSVVAGVLLFALGVREYRHGHAHVHGEAARDHHGREAAPSHDHPHGHTRPHPHGDDHTSDGGVDRLKRRLPFVGGHTRDHGDRSGAADRGLFGIAWFAFVLGFAHEEEFEIIALCAGSVYCLELMAAYALTVILGIVGLTMLLIAGYEHSEERVERYTPYLPAFSAAVLGVMGIGFVLGVL